MQTNELTIRLTVDQVNTILKYLGNGSYIEVSDIINQIRSQAVPQLVVEPQQEETVSE